MAKMLRTALVMHPVVRDELIRDDHMERLARAVDLVSPEPVRSFDVLGVELGRIEVLITSWGAPPVGPASAPGAVTAVAGCGGRTINSRRGRWN